LSLGFCLVLLAIPFAAAIIDGVFLKLVELGLWRVLLAPVVVSLYILLIAPPLVGIGLAVLTALRSLTTLNEIDFQNLVEARGYVPPIIELGVIGIGLAAGLWLGIQGLVDRAMPWLSGYWIACSALMWALLIWTIFVSFVSTRVTAAAHRYLGPIDLFDLSPFEPISRQSLLLALVFVGGITLSLLFSYSAPNLRSPVFWFIYLLLGSVPVLVFFMNMRSTHQILAIEKNCQLITIQRQLQPLGGRLLNGLEMDAVDSGMANQLIALLAYEQRVKEARTWPYNTTALRTVFFSVLIPLATVLARLLIEVIKP
jgi:hypothetical protein